MIALVMFTLRPTESRFGAVYEGVTLRERL